MHRFVQFVLAPLFQPFYFFHIIGILPPFRLYDVCLLVRYLDKKIRSHIKRRTNIYKFQPPAFLISSRKEPLLRLERINLLSPHISLLVQPAICRPRSSKLKSACCSVLKNCRPLLAWLIHHLNGLEWQNRFHHFSRLSIPHQLNLPFIVFRQIDIAHINEIKLIMRASLLCLALILSVFHGSESF